MTKLNEIYKCSECSNIVELTHASTGELFCHGKPMELLVEKTKDLGFEKHVPVIEIKKGIIKVKIGSIPHPMLPEHYIEWIELIAGERVYKKFLKPNDKPEAEFFIDEKKVTVREYCSVHGLWKN